MLWTQLPHEQRWDRYSWDAWWADAPADQRERLLDAAHGQDPPLSDRLRALSGAVEDDEENQPPARPVEGPSGAAALSAHQGLPRIAG